MPLHLYSARLPKLLPRHCYRRRHLRKIMTIRVAEQPWASTPCHAYDVALMPQYREDAASRKEVPQVGEVNIISSIWWPLAIIAERSRHEMRA